MIEVKSLCKSYIIKNKKIDALNDINLSIHQGEIFGVIGESGSGKSTLIRTLNFLEKPTSGEVLIENINLATLSAKDLRKKRHRIGMIFQNFNLLESRTALENIALPLEFIGKSKNKTQQTALALLEWVGLSAHKNHYPSQLSGGQKQRIAIARALATDPHILLCDEPTSALDPKSTYSILNLLKKINKKLGVTIVFITHEMDAIKHICDRAAVLDKGQLIEQGSVVDLFTKARSPITQQLVQKFLHFELPESIKNKMDLYESSNKSYIVRFIFFGNDSDQPLISTLITTFSVTINLIQANIESIQDTTVGFTICQISGEAENIQNALEHVKTTSIALEVLGYV